MALSQNTILQHHTVAIIYRVSECSYTPTITLVLNPVRRTTYTSSQAAFKHRGKVNNSRSARPQLPAGSCHRKEKWSGYWQSSNLFVFSEMVSTRFLPSKRKFVLVTVPFVLALGGNSWLSTSLVLDLLYI